MTLRPQMVQPIDLVGQSGGMQVDELAGRTAYSPVMMSIGNIFVL